MSKILIEEMSWKEFENVMKDNDTLIIPVGVTEEHGLHNPLGTDTLIAKECAYRIGKLTNVPVAAELPYGYSPNVVNFEGTSSLDPILYKKVLMSYCESYIKHGIKRILFVNGHGGNTDTLALVTRELFDKFGVLSFTNQWWEVLPQINSEWNCADHGGYFETSMMMAVNPDIVNMDLASAGKVTQLTEEIAYNHGWKFGGASISMTIDLKKVHKYGNVGNEPFGANAELGEKMIEVYVDFNVKLVNEMKKVSI